MDYTWIKTYKNSNQIWVSDSLNWDLNAFNAGSEWSITSFLVESAMIQNYFNVNFLTKLSFLDSFLILTNNKVGVFYGLYNSIMIDWLLHITTCFLPLTMLLQSEYQENLNLILLVSPELSIMFYDYISNYFFSNIFNLTPVAVTDFFLSNLNYSYSEGVLYFFFFVFYIWFIIYTFATPLILQWNNLISAQFFRFYYFFYSLSVGMRIHFEVVLQTVVFFFFYWIVVIMTFDDDQEEIIEFVDNGFTYFFCLLITYLIVKYSIHYFAFTEVSVTEGRTVTFITTQFFKDFIGSLSLIFRFYILLFRINVYDTLDDFFDSFYIFVGDFDDDEYLNEVFLSIHGTILFTLNNHDDHSFLWEDEHSFTNDFFYLYFILWGKISFFFFFMLEEAARLALAFYICYLIIFEVHSANCSYYEDNFMLSKKFWFDLKRSDSTHYKWSN